MKWTTISADHQTVQEQSFISGTHKNIKGSPQTKSGEHQVHTEGMISQIGLAVPMTAAYNQLAELRSKLVAIVKDTNADVIALKGELVKVAAQLDQALLHLQREITKLQAAQAQLNAKANLESQRTTFPPRPSDADAKERKPKRNP
jgi:hypothetical protein